MSARLFTACSVPHGDKIVSGVEMRCGKCAGIERKPRGSTKTMVGPDEESRRYRFMFERAGWRIGARPQDDRCPRCVAVINAAKPTKPAPTAQEKPIMTLASPAAAQPRAMSPDDSRIIFSKLEETYDTTTKAYRVPWHDQKVATDLGVPRAWVETIRKTFFGPDGGNPEIAAALAEATELLTSTRELLGRIDQHKAATGTLTSEAQKLAGRADMIERRVAGIEKAVRP